MYFDFSKYKAQSTKLVLLKKFSGGCVERATPVPIPNTEVKPLGADGTARATVWESRKPPGLFRRKPAESNHSCGLLRINYFTSIAC